MGDAEVMERMRLRQDVDPSECYFRVSPKFEAPEGEHDWLNRFIFVGVAEKTPAGDSIHYYKIL